MRGAGRLAPSLPKRRSRTVLIDVPSVCGLMTGGLYLARRTAAHRWGSLLALGCLLAVGFGIASASLDASERTRTAYGRYLEHAEVGDLVINPSLLTSDVDKALRHLPGVTDVHTDNLLLATFDEGAPRAAGTLDSASESVRGSIDGRYRQVDRPAVSVGRLPTGRREAFLSKEVANRLRVQVGDELPIAFWTSAETLGAPDVRVKPIGVEHLRVVGIGTLADEFLPDELYPRFQVIVSGDVAVRYSCVPDNPGRDATMAEALAALFPERCAIQYRYYSLHLAKHGTGVGKVVARFSSDAAKLNDELPAVARKQGIGYYAIPTTTHDEAARVARSLRPTVAVVALFGAAAAVATLVVVSLAFARLLRRSRADSEVWEQLGAPRSTRFMGVVLPYMAMVPLSLAVGTLIAYGLSGLGPFGVARAIEPSPGLRLDPAIVGLSLVAAGGLIICLFSALAWQAVRTPSAQPLPAVRRRLSSGLLRVAPLSAAEGFTAATDRRRDAGGRLGIASAAAAIAALTAALVFGSNLGSLLAEPGRFGWPWDAAAVVNYGYGGTNVKAVAADLDGRRDVVSWGAAAVTSEVTVAGRSVPGFVALSRQSTLPLPVLDGRFPRHATEIALGRRTAADLHLGVGDRTRIAGRFGAHEVTVSGLVVLPSFGPVLADRAGLGIGALYPASIVPTAGASGSEENVSDEPGSDASFIAVRLASGSKGARKLWAGLGPRIRRWTSDNARPFTYDSPVRSPEIVNVQSMRRGPIAVAAALAVTVVAGMALSLALSVRARRRHLALLRVFGFTGRQVRRCVRWQAVTTIVLGAAIGLAPGAAVGRFAWGRFARDLGVDPAPSVPVLVLLALVMAAVGVGILVSVLPAVTASRYQPATTLRQE